MNEVLAITLNSMHQDLSRMDRVALNLANSLTPGFKREVLGARPFTAALDAAGEAAAGSSSPERGTLRALGTLEILRDSRPGTLKMTSEPLDLAITGDAYFEVSTEDGLAYTRQGNFQVDGKGRLVTAQGHPVMGTNGDIFLTTRTPVIDGAGNITEPNATTGLAMSSPGLPVAQLKLVRFDNPDQLERLGNGLVAAGAGMSLLGESESQVRQGVLENANVSSLQEMVQMMQTMRHFESVQKMTQGYDEMIGTAIHKLGDLS